MSRPPWKWVDKKGGHYNTCGWEQEQEQGLWKPVDVKFDLCCGKSPENFQKGPPKNTTSILQKKKTQP